VGVGGMGVGTRDGTPGRLKLQASEITIRMKIAICQRGNRRFIRSP
jgi:hypothetical protein